MNSTNVSNMLPMIAFVSSCIATFAVLLFINFVFDKIDGKFETIKNTKIKYENEVKNLHCENEEQANRIGELTMLVEELRYELDSRPENIDKYLMKENRKLEIKCDMLVEELEKQRKQKRRTNKKNKTPKINLRKLVYSDEVEC